MNAVLKMCFSFSVYSSYFDVYSESLCGNGALISILVTKDTGWNIKGKSVSIFDLKTSGNMLHRKIDGLSCLDVKSIF